MRGNQALAVLSALQIRYNRYYLKSKTIQDISQTLDSLDKLYFFF